MKFIPLNVHIFSGKDLNVPITRANVSFHFNFYYPAGLILSLRNRQPDPRDSSVLSACLNGRISRVCKLSVDRKPKSTLVLAVNRAHRLWLYGHVHAQRTVQSARNQVRDRKTQSASLTMSYIYDVHTLRARGAHSLQL